MFSNLILPGPKMIFIPGGTYRMGERKNIVTVQDFFMDETPVTVAQYREAVKAGACSSPRKHYNSNYYIKGRKNHPINCVSWYQACAYAEWAGKRLPTEEEWEWAARGGDEGRMYPWGGAEHPPSDHLCWDGSGNDLGRGNRQSTSPVGSYPKGNSKHGLKDMAGNVYEWTVSAYASTSEARVIRGGSWDDYDHDDVRASIRSRDSPTFCYDYLGVRCVRSV